jgi:hypothetical protein
LLHLFLQVAGAKLKIVWPDLLRWQSICVHHGEEIWALCPLPQRLIYLIIGVWGEAPKKIFKNGTL